MSRLLLVLGLVAPLAAHARPPAPDDAAAQAFATALARMKTVADTTDEYTVRFYKREYVDGAMTPEEVIDVAWRRPWDVLMRWVDGGSHAGRLLLYRGHDWNDGRFVIDPGPFLPVVSLDPTSRLAMSGARHSLYDLPMYTVVDRFVHDAEKVAQNPVWVPEVVDEGPSVVRGEPTHCFLTEIPKDQDPTFYAKRIRACINEKTGLLNAVRAWDVVNGTLVLVEEYDYIGLNLNPGLGDAAFDRDALGL